MAEYKTRNVLNLEIHNLPSREKFEQLKAEGELDPNALYFTPDETNDIFTEAFSVAASMMPPVLTHAWFDHEVDDMSWLCADTFSWHSGDKYKAAYEHLVHDFENAQTATYFAWEGENQFGGQETVYTTSQNPSVGDPVYFYVRYDEMLDTFGVVNTVDSGSITITYYDGAVSTAKAYGGEVQIATHFETVAGVTIAYRLAQDGHKIAVYDTNPAAIYEATGVSWYYVLDKSNKQFKLPRTKWGFTGLRDSVGSMAFTGTSGATPDYSSGVNISNGWVAEYDCVGYAQVDQNNNKSGLISVDGKTVYRYAGGDYPKAFGVTFIVPKGSTVTYSGNWAVSPVVYKLKTVYDKSPATQMYLYFFVGNFEQTAIEQTAGLNAEMFNNKADMDLGNIPTNYDYVIESQLPTADNGYTWYRKYKSGWVEQGGYLSGNWTGAKTFNLPVVMSNASYTVTNTVGCPNISGMNGLNWLTGRTTTSITFTSRSLAGNFETNRFSWQVSGMAA